MVGGGCWVGGGWVSCSILESAPVPFGFRYYWDLVGVGPRGFCFGTKGLGAGLDNEGLKVFAYISSIVGGCNLALLRTSCREQTKGEGSQEGGARAEAAGE